MDRSALESVFGRSDLSIVYSGNNIGLVPLFDVFFYEITKLESVRAKIQGGLPNIIVVKIIGDNTVVRVIMEICARIYSYHLIFDSGTKKFE